MSNVGSQPQWTTITQQTDNLILWFYHWAPKYEIYRGLIYRGLIYRGLIYRGLIYRGLIYRTEKDKIPTMKRSESKKKTHL